MFVQIKNLTKTYKKFLAVNKINFEIKKMKQLVYWGLMDAGKQLL